MQLIKTLLLIGFGVLFLQGCATSHSLQVLESTKESPTVQVSPIEDRLAAVPALDGPVITIAVYGFRDATGQRKPADNIANLSSAVTQGSEVWVIKALQDVGNGVWFEVVERVGMDNLIKEQLNPSSSNP